jgi:hypothetical protein
VPRIVLALVIGLLALSASGVESVFIQEPCGINEQSAREDGACAPTCVTCGCCARAIEPVGVAVVNDPGRPSPPAVTRPHDLLPTNPADVLHVPKALLRS